MDRDVDAERIERLEYDNRSLLVELRVLREECENAHQAHCEAMLECERLRDKSDGNRTVYRVANKVFAMYFTTRKLAENFIGKNGTPSNGLFNVEEISVFGESIAAKGEG